MKSGQCLQKLWLEVLCCAVYFVSYVTRINFGASLSEIIAAENFLKSSVAIATTLSFLSYGVGQIISGYIGDRVSPKWMIFVGLLATGICNVVIAFCRTEAEMAVVWTINGFAQAMLWPPLVKIMADYYEPVQFSRVSSNVVAASSAATVFIYLCIPLIIQVGGWRMVFAFSAAAAIGMALFWLAKMSRIEKNLSRTVPLTSPQSQQNENNGRKFLWRLTASSGLLFIFGAIIMQGMMRDGITTWLPSLVSETYGVAPAMSIFMSVLLPVFSMVSLKVFALIQRKWVHNEVMLSLYLFSTCAVCCICWGLVYRCNMAVTVLLAAVIMGCTFGINLMLVCMVPKYFAATGRVSAISGIINFFTYVGSAVSTYGVAKIAEIAGWQMTIWTWLGAAALGIVVCILSVRRFAQVRAQARDNTVYPMETTKRL